ncbi:MAG: HlyD family efflux transporter periplasmic adaptor subunit [Bacteroidota bacterium]
MPPKDFIDLRSEEVQEILGSPPGLLVRWGTTIVLLGIVLLLLAAWFVKYPDVVQADIEITTTTPPADVVARTDGRMQAIFVKDTTLVRENQPLAVMQSTADYKDMLLLDSCIAVWKTYASLDFRALEAPDSLHLGDLLADYSSFSRLLSDFQSTDDASPEAGATRTLLQNSLNLLSTALDRWKQSYLIVAPASGKVSLNDLKTGSFVRVGLPLITILPPGSPDAIIGRATVPVATGERIQPGQRVVMKVAGYPASVFGTVEGIVVSKALMPREKSYSVSINLTEAKNNKIRTSLDKEIRFEQRLGGSASILVDNRGVLPRILDEIDTHL